MTTTKQRYKNGNCHVILYGDGRKVRSWPDGEAARAEFPESVDLKITNYCDAGCSFCHESSTVAGKHAKIRDILDAVAGLPPGVEIAIGGGDPLAHPRIHELLYKFALLGLVPSITVRAKHYYECSLRIMDWYTRRWINGLGISVDDFTQANVMHETHSLDRVVYHVIMGMCPLASLMNCHMSLPLLILGHKDFGFGRSGHEKAMAALPEWLYWRHLLMNGKHSVSFDNLALEQLKLKEYLPAEMWAKHFMGHDGEFTMYYDAVKGEFAESSTGVRRTAGPRTIAQCFKELRDGK